MKLAWMMLLGLFAACSSTSHDAAGDSGVDGHGSGSGSGSGGGDSIYALAVGHTWHSTQMSSGVGQPMTCEITLAITGMQDIDGRHAFVETYTAACPTGTNTSTMYVARSDDDKIESRSSASPTWYVWDPPSEGHTWASAPDGSFVYTWHGAGTVTVPAGTFDGCWTATTMQGGSNQSFTYCKNAGQVRADQSFTTGYTMQTRLDSKSF